MAVVTFEEDGSTIEFVLDECTTSNTRPGNFVNVGPEGAFTSHGVLDNGWELQLSMIPDATGSIINLSFLTDGDEIDYQLGNLTYEVNGGGAASTSLRLVRDSGWTPDRYESWLLDLLGRFVFGSGSVT